MTYYQNMVFQKIEVIAYFKDLDIKIVKFKWNDTIYKVARIANKWKIQDGDDLTTHFSVICLEQNIIAELCYHHKDFKWELIQYDNLN